MDDLTPEQRRKNMKAIKCKDSDIELMLRKALWKKGLRYRKNVKTVYGHPDIAFIGKKVAVFCDSEFWHGYNFEVNKEKTYWDNYQNAVREVAGFGDHGSSTPM